MEIRSIVSIVIMFIGFIFLLIKNPNKKIEFSTKFLARTAIFAAISIILYIVPIFHIALPIFPSFLELHFDEIPAFIAGLAYGPLSAVMVLIVKTIAKLPMTTTLGVGELADLIYSLAFILPACFIYKKIRNKKGVIIGFTISFFSQLFVASFLTSFVMIYFYILIMGISQDALLNMCKSICPYVTSLDWPFFFFVALPFNAIKDVIVLIVTFFLYKRLHLLIDKIKV